MESPSFKRHAKFVVDGREMGSMLVLLSNPLPLRYLLFCTLLAGVSIAMMQVYVFLLIAWFWEIYPPITRFFSGFSCINTGRFNNWCAGVIAIFVNQTTGKFCRRYELHHLPDVFHFVRIDSFAENS